LLYLSLGTVSVDFNWHQYFPLKWPELNYNTTTLSMPILRQLQEQHCAQQFELFKQGYERPLVTVFARLERVRQERLRLLRRARNRINRREAKRDYLLFLAERRKSLRSLFLPQDRRVHPLSDSLAESQTELDDAMRLMDLRNTAETEVNPHFASPALWWQQSKVGREELYNRVLQELQRTDLPLKAPFKEVVEYRNGMVAGANGGAKEQQQQQQEQEKRDTISDEEDIDEEAEEDGM
jgi:hypothetical protein